MEALTAVSVALLTVYDMGKALDKGMVIDGVRLVSKTGGKSGDWRQPRRHPRLEPGSRSPSPTFTCQTSGTPEIKSGVTILQIVRRAA